MSELALRNTIPTEHEMAVFHAMSEQAITSKMYGSNHKDKSSVMMIMLSARELGIPPMQALNGGINIIQGKVEISARMMSALIRRSGHRIKVQECSNNQCVLVGQRGDTGETQSASFSIAEAQLAGLMKQGGGWYKWPKDMCFARALSRLARQLFSDVIGIGYVEGEISQMNDVKPEIEEITIENVQDETKYLFDRYVALFDHHELLLANEWLAVIMKHFNWNFETALKNLLHEEDKIRQKFTKWMDKRMKNEENLQN